MKCQRIRIINLLVLLLFFQWHHLVVCQEATLAPEPAKEADHNNSTSDDFLFDNSTIAVSNNNNDPCAVGTASCQACTDASQVLLNDPGSNDTVCLWDVYTNECTMALLVEHPEALTICQLLIQGNNNNNNNNNMTDNTNQDEEDPTLLLVDQNEVYCGDGSECATSRCKDGIQALEVCLDTSTDSSKDDCLECIRPPFDGNSTLAVENSIDTIISCATRSSCADYCGTCWIQALELSECAWGCNNNRTTTTTNVTADPTSGDATTEPPVPQNEQEQQDDGNTALSDPARNEAFCGDGSQCASNCNNFIQAFQTCLDDEDAADKTQSEACLKCIRPLLEETITIEEYNQNICETRSSCQTLCGVCSEQAMEVSACAWGDCSTTTGENVFDRPTEDDTVWTNKTVSVTLNGLNTVLNSQQEDIFADTCETFLGHLGDKHVEINVLAQRAKHTVTRRRRRLQAEGPVVGIQMALTSNRLHPTSSKLSVEEILQEDAFLKNMQSKDDVFANVSSITLDDITSTDNEWWVEPPSSIPSPQPAEQKERNKVVLFAVPLLGFVLLSFMFSILLALGIKRALDQQEKVLHTDDDSSYQGESRGMYSGYSREGDVAQDYHGGGPLSTTDEESLYLKESQPRGSSARQGNVFKKQLRGSSAREEESARFYHSRSHSSLGDIHSDSSSSQEQLDLLEEQLNEEPESFITDESDEYVSEDHGASRVSSSVDFGSTDSSSSGDGESSVEKFLQEGDEVVDDMVPSGFFDSDDISTGDHGRFDDERNDAFQPFSYDQAHLQENENSNSGVLT